MLDDPRVERFVGPDVEYYRARWQRFIERPGTTDIRTTSKP